MTDPSKRPLTFPKWHIPYLEKHRILELFHELARELVIQKPEDHILFMKQMLQQAAASRDVARVILISSPKIHRKSIAEEIAKLSQQIVITLNDLENMFAFKTEVTSDMMAKAVTCLVRSQSMATCGWIIADIINTEEEAKNLLKYGVLPTHVLFLIPPFQPKLDELLYCDVPENWPVLRRNFFALRDIYKKTLREVPIANKNLQEVARDCFAICKVRQPVKRVKPRVVIIGPRGSGRKTQASLLVEMMGLVHVDFEQVLCTSWMSDTSLGEQLRQCKKYVCFHSELLSQIVNKRVLEDDCLERGWVLTGYPFTVTDFKFLDSLPTPPNRAILIDCDLNVCKERIRYRQINAYTGSVTNLIPSNDQSNNPFSSDNKSRKKVLNTHPKDSIEMLEAEHDFYCENYGAIKKYCGDTAMVVNGDQNERWVYESITAFIYGANPTGAPRQGFGHEIPEVCSCDCINIPPRVAKTYALSI